MVKTYILAPNWSTAPPPEGPIDLGHILDDVIEFVPLNRRKIIEIPGDERNPVDFKSGFSTSRSKLLSGELGFFAKVLGLVGVGAGANFLYMKAKDDVLSCKHLETVTFDPTASYIADSMALPEVNSFMQGCRFKEPVYMVTGLKIGRGGSLKSSSSSDVSVKIEGGLNPPGSPAQVGVKAGYVNSAQKGEGWNDSTDFIVAFRVRKIWYRHGDVNAIKNKAHNEKVVMQDGASVGSAPTLPLQWNDDIPFEDVVAQTSLTMDKEFEDGEEVRWIIPDVNT